MGALTERRNPRTAEIDLASALEIVDLINAEDRTVADAVHEQRGPIAEALTAAEQRAACGRTAVLRRRRHVGPARRARCERDSSDVRRAAGAGAGHHRGRRGRAHALAGGRRGPARGRARRPRQGRRPRRRSSSSGSPPAAPRPTCAPRCVHAKRLGARTAIVACSPPPADTLAAADIAIVVLHGSRGRHRLDAHEGRHGDEARAEHDHHRRDDPARQDVRQPDGGPAGVERKAAGSRGAHRARGVRRFRRRTPRAHCSAPPTAA